MAEKRYYWLKLKDDFFRQKPIKKLRSMEHGETYTIIYLKMQLESLSNNGIIVFDGVGDSFSEELAFQIDEHEPHVRTTIEFLTKHGLLVQLSETENFLPQAVENTGSETSSAKRMREFREREAAQCSDNASQCDAREKREERREKSGADKPPRRSRFVPPTVEQVAEYVRSRSSSVDPQGFIDFYEAKGWMVGRTPMKDWKAACRNAESWERWKNQPQTPPRRTGHLVVDENGEEVVRFD